MNIIVFGASGSVGIELVKQSLEKGFQVTAFVRNPTNFPLQLNEQLKIFQGDVRNLTDVKNALENQDAVFCTLGDGKIGKIRTEGTQNIISAMQFLSKKRLICQTTLGMGESYENLNFIWKHIMFGWLLKKAFKDHQQQENLVLNSNLDYTLVRPSALIDGEIDQKYEIGFDGKRKGLTLKISRKNVADFMLKQLDDKTYLRKAVSIST